MLYRFRVLRDAAGLSPEELDERLILGPGWVRRFESGEVIPGLDVLVVMLAALRKDVGDLIEGVIDGLEPDGATAAAVDRFVSAQEVGGNLEIRFRYAAHDAVYRLPGAKLEEYEEVVKVLRDGLARLVSGDSDERAVKTDAVARTFLRAVQLWPRANPSDLWWFLVMRAFNDPFNHPAAFARLDFGQSWKRTGGWALEEVLIRLYGPALREHGIRLFVATMEERRRYLRELAVADRLEAAKMDVLLVGQDRGRERCFGVVHVKSSFAERRTDDVPMSKALVDGGYCSPLWTLDCKSGPGAEPRNQGELGKPKAATGPDRRSAKRKDIEDDGYFSACFSYNARTHETPADQDARGRVIVCDFRDPSDDAFTRFIRSEWGRFTTPR